MLPVNDSVLSPETDSLTINAVTGAVVLHLVLQLVVKIDDREQEAHTEVLHYESRKHNPHLQMHVFKFSDATSG
jgi:hypothetical protein